MIAVVALGMVVTIVSLGLPLAVSALYLLARRLPLGLMRGIAFGVTISVAAAWCFLAHGFLWYGG